ncbi:MAG: nuclear transport factor 2 family protein [Solirubrobacterales bacterium]
MSEENIDAVRRANQAFNDGDIDRGLELWDPEAVYYEQPGTPLDTGEVLRGRDQIRASLMSYLEEFPDFHSEIEEMVDAGDKVVCVQRWTGTGRGSGLSVSQPEILLLSFDNGKIIEGRAYPDRASALEAAGLPE